MKPTDLFPLLSAYLLLLATLASAWSLPDALDHKIDAWLVRRQDQNDDNNNATSSEGTVTQTGTVSPSQSGSITVAPSASASGSGGSVSGNATKTTSTKTTPIDPRLPPGGIALITPALIDGPQYYKVGDNVTLKWNYTSLSVTPSAIDVLASCSLNGQTYTLTSNMSVQETGLFTWDTGEQYATATNPFPVASYTLIIHDSSKDITDIPSAGFLGTFEQYVFGMYTP
jgi:hypothetical protein